MSLTQAMRKNPVKLFSLIFGHWFMMIHLKWILETFMHTFSTVSFRQFDRINQYIISVVVMVIEFSINLVKVKLFHVGFPILFSLLWVLSRESNRALIHDPYDIGHTIWPINR